MRGHLFGGAMMALMNSIGLAARTPLSRSGGPGWPRHKNAGLSPRERQWRERERALNRAALQKGVAS